VVKFGLRYAEFIHGDLLGFCDENEACVGVFGSRWKEERWCGDVYLWMYVGWISWLGIRLRSINYAGKIGSGRLGQTK
jgi:hypothetical protein